MKTQAELRVLKGEAVEQILDDLAMLRIQVFREWPYLYDGNLVYERRYMASYRNNPNAVLVAAFDGDRLVGASTGTPLEAHSKEFSEPLDGRGIDMARCFYCAESVLLPEYRGQGLGHGFFDMREAHARDLGMTASLFCAVVRPADHPGRPDRYRPLDPFWKKRGYVPLDGCVATFSWRDLGGRERNPQAFADLAPDPMRIAAAAWPLTWHDGWDSFEKKVRRWVSETDADLLVFPEYGLMELVSLAGRPLELDASAAFVSDATPRVEGLFEELAKGQGKYILAPSGPVETAGRFVNRASFFGPLGRLGHQDKQIMTPWERDPWCIVPGDPLRLFETPIGAIGVLICYDAEFPLLGRALVEAGAEILLCPSATEDLSGSTRVTLGARARAMEGQCISVVAPLLGSAPWCEAVDANRGRAGMYGPPDRGFPQTGILAEGDIDLPGWTQSGVDLGAIEQVRRCGQVRAVLHWPEQAKKRCQSADTFAP